MKLVSFLILIVHPMMPVNPALGPNNDWAPLKAEYMACAESATGYFSYVACTVGAQDRALHPVTSA